MVGFSSKFFWYENGAKKYFRPKFLADRPNFRPKIHIWNSKIWGNFEKKKQKKHFFSNVAPDVIWCLKKKKSFSRLFSPYKAPKKFLLKLVNFSCQNFSSKTLRIFDFRKKHKKFHFFFTSWKMRENVKKQKLQKKK